MSQATAYRVSPELLAREDFRAACEKRNLGEVFRLIRKWDGVSQDRMSSPIDGLSQSRVSRIMAGANQVTSMDLIERIADGLRIPGSYFRLAPRPWESTTAAVVDARVTAVTPAASAAPVAPTRIDGTALTAAPQSEPFPLVRVERPVGLRPHIERAFAQTNVTIDFAGFSGETLAGALSEPLDMVRSGKLTPTSIRIRVLVPDTGQAWALPCRIEDLADEPAFRQRHAGIADRSLSTILDTVTELQELGAIGEAVAEVRVHRLTPVFKLYVINGQDAFFGFYPITEHLVKAQGGMHAMYDLMGKDSLLFHHSSDGDPQSPAAQYVAQARTWFDSVWATVARGYQHD